MWTVEGVSAKRYSQNNIMIAVAATLTNPTEGVGKGHRYAKLACVIHEPLARGEILGSDIIIKPLTWLISGIFNSCYMINDKAHATTH